MKRVISLFFVSCAMLLFSEETVYISLGSSCEPAFRLNDCNLRFASYPFDWITSYFEAVYSAIEDDFNHFFSELRLAADETATEDYYGLYFHHVWHYGTSLPSSESLKKIDWRSLAGPIWEKLKRRTDRFKATCSSSKNVIFVRYDFIDREKAVILRDLIRSKYPGLHFILMVVKPDVEFQSPWNLEGVRNFSIKHFDIPKWDEAFKQVASELDLSRGI